MDASAGHSPDCNSFRTRILVWNEDDQVHWVHRTVGEVDNGSSFSERWNQDSVLLSEPASGKETSRQEGGSHATNGNNRRLF